MPRAPCIDRTLTITEATVVALDLKKHRSVERVVYVPKDYETNIGLLRAIQNSWTDSKTVPVHILESKSYRRDFHMTETEYINYIIEKEKRA
jgi:hypothetical protein